MAVAHGILVMSYHMLKKGVLYQELGADYFDKRDAREQSEWDCCCQGNMSP